MKVVDGCQCGCDVHGVVVWCGGIDVNSSPNLPPASKRTANTNSLFFVTNRQKLGVEFYCRWTH